MSIQCGEHVQLLAPSRAHNCDSCGASCPSLPLAARFELHEKRHRVNAPLAYLSGSPVKEPFHQVPLTELPRREMLYSYSPPFVFQRPRYTSPLPVGPLWRERPATRAFLYTSSRVPHRAQRERERERERERRCTSRAPFIHLSKVHGKWASSNMWK